MGNGVGSRARNVGKNFDPDEDDRDDWDGEEDRDDDGDNEDDGDAIVETKHNVCCKMRGSSVGIHI